MLHSFPFCNDVKTGQSQIIARTLYMCLHGCPNKKTHTPYRNWVQALESAANAKGRTEQSKQSMIKHCTLP